MDIGKENFEACLPLLQEAISKCDFVAMDTELTGLAYPANVPKAFDSLETRYEKVSRSAAQFSVIQLGICTFTWSDDIGGYEARPFNFYCFPSAEHSKHIERFFTCQASSMEFLIANGFDFNKWVREGVPYMTYAEERTHEQKCIERASTSTAPPNDIAIDDRNREFYQTTKATIQEWLQGKGSEDNKDPEAISSVTINAPNSFFRRLVHQMIKNEFNGKLHASSNTQERTMRLSVMTAEKEFESTQVKLGKAPFINLRRVLDATIRSKKPLIGHNCYLDLMQLTQQFLIDLPYEMDDWKGFLMQSWGTIIDTKHLASHRHIAPLLSTTGLENVSACVQSEPFSTIGPKIVMADGFDRYLADASTPMSSSPVPPPSTAVGFSSASVAKDTKYHEAGYDAYITGQAFLRFAGMIMSETQLAVKEAERIQEERRAQKVANEKTDSVDGLGQTLQVLENGPENSSADPASRTILSSDEPKEEAEKSEKSTTDDSLGNEYDEDGEYIETELEKRAILIDPTQDFLTMPEITSFYNQLHIMRSDISVMNLAGQDAEPEEKPLQFMLRDVPSQMHPSSLFLLFAAYSPARFHRVDEGQMWMFLRDPSKPQRPPVLNGHVSGSAAGSSPSSVPGTPVMASSPGQILVPTGRLGEEFVHPMCVGDSEAAVKGRAGGIVMEAADIIVLSWKTWWLENQEEQRVAAEKEKNGEANDNQRQGSPSIFDLPTVPVVSTAAVATASSAKRTRDEMDSGGALPTNPLQQDQDQQQQQQLDVDAETEHKEKKAKVE